MKKSLINGIKFLVLIILVFGFIYVGTRDYDNSVKKTKEELKLDFKKEYSNLKDKHVYEYIKTDKLLDLFESGSGIVLFCSSETTWCQKYLTMVDDIASSNNIDTIYYYDIFSDKKENNSAYRRIKNYVNDYLYQDVDGNEMFFEPDLYAIKNGSIIGHNNTSSLTVKNDDIDIYWNEEKKLELNSDLTVLFKNYNN